MQFLREKVKAEVDKRPYTPPAPSTIRSTAKPPSSRPSRGGSASSVSRSDWGEWDDRGAGAAVQVSSQSAGLHLLSLSDTAEGRNLLLIYQHGGCGTGNLREVPPVWEWQLGGFQRQSIAILLHYQCRRAKRDRAAGHTDHITASGYGQVQVHDNKREGHDNERRAWRSTLSCGCAGICRISLLDQQHQAVWWRLLQNRVGQVSSQ